MSPIFFSLVRKETFSLIRDKRTLLVVLVMPVILLLLFGFAISMEINNVRVAVAVTRHTDDTRLTIERLRTNPYLTFEGLTPAEEADAILRWGEADAVLILQPGSDGKLRSQIIADAANPVTARSTTAYITSILPERDGTAPIVTRTLYNPQLKSAYNFVPGILGMIFILICAIMTSVSIVGEKENGTMDLLLVSPVRPEMVILGKLVPYFLLSCLLLAMMLTIGYTVLGLPFGPSVFDIIWFSLLYVTLSLSIGLLVSTIVKTRTSALIVSAVMFMIPVIMLSGMIFPIDSMPDILQWISGIVPARWYISGMRKMMIQQISPDHILTEICILAGMTSVILALAIIKFKRKG